MYLHLLSLHRQKLVVELFQRGRGSPISETYRRSKGIKPVAIGVFGINNGTMHSIC